MGGLYENACPTLRSRISFGPQRNVGNMEFAFRRFSYLSAFILFRCVLSSLKMNDARSYGT